MRIVIVGAGMVGTQLAKHLIQEKHDVSIIEANEERARHASNRIDCMVIHDEGNSIKALEEAGIAKADALVCVTNSDEVNMIICGLAASRYGQDFLKIARVRNDDYMHLSRSGNRQVLGIDHFIHPNIEASRSIIRAIDHGAMGHIISFSNTSYELGSIEVAEKSAFDGLALTDYRNLVTIESLVTLVERDDEVLLPSGATVLRHGDRVHIVANAADLPDIFKYSGGTEKPIRKIGIVGGGRTGALIADGLLNRDVPAGEMGREAPAAKKKNFIFPLLKTLIPRSSRRLVIIERDYRLCKDLAARFPEALILNEDISDESFVNEEQLDDLDLLVTTTANQELNIITAVYLKARGIERAIAIVTGSGYAAMARQMGVDVVIPMQTVVVDSILSHLMGSGVKEVHRIGDGSVDIIEVEIAKDAPVADKPISEFKLSAGGLLMLVNRGENSFIPKGGYVFNEGDRIVVIAKTGSQAEIEKYFGVSEA